MIRGAQMSNRSHATCQEGKGEGRERKKVLAWPTQVFVPVMSASLGMRRAIVKSIEFHFCIQGNSISL